MSNRKQVDVTTLVPSAQNASEEPPEPGLTVLMHLVAGNPDNPRSVDDYTDKDPEFVELKRSMGEVGQLQPIGVISREAWLARKPDHAKQIGKAQYVVFGGNRRLAAAKALRWTLIDIRVQDHLAQPGQGDEDRLDDAVIIENIHRKNLAPVKEAELLQRMVDRHGSQEKVAERIGKSQMYVSHRLALLNLAPDIQQQVDAGQVKLKQARQLGRTTDHEQQRAMLQAAKVKPLEPEAPASAPLQNPVLRSVPDPIPAADEDGLQNPVLNEDDQDEVRPTADSPQNPVLDQAPAGPSEPEVPEPRASEDESPLGGVWEDGDVHADEVIARMSAKEIHRLTMRLINYNTGLQAKQGAAS